MMVADAAVEFLLSNLQELLLRQVHLISNAKNQVESLEKDMRLFKAFLRDSTKKRRKDESFRELVAQIREVVYEAEDIIDAFVTQATESKSKSYFSRAFHKPANLLTIANVVECVGAKVRDIYGDKSKIEFASLTVGDGGSSNDFKPDPRVRPEEVVGFKKEVDTIKEYLYKETHELDVFSIIGMPGLGKTTLTGKIFEDPQIKYDFPTRIWIYVSQEFTVKDIFITILREFTSNITDDMYRKSDQALADLVSSHLEGRKFLIVMDDVWAANDWEKLHIAFPKKNNKGKILITSRLEEVARSANRVRNPHMLRFLDSEESWLLLKLKVFGTSICPYQDLEAPGKLIVEQCRGLPLAIVVIGGILVKNFFGSNEVEMERSWKKVSQNVNAYLNDPENDPEKRMEKIIALSYDKLPHYLQPCFLYFGIFPEDFEIPVWKLVRMWIAEGFIQQKDTGSLEDTAHSYLNDLINRNLVSVDKKKYDGKVKTCRIHDMLREFCKTEAGKDTENFLQEIKKSSDGDGDFKPPVSEVPKFRRLCIHTNVLTFVSSKPFGPRVRTFACFSKEEIPLPAQSVSDIPAAFKLIRVLEVSPIKFTKIPTDIYQLVHLRYITLSFTLSVLPSHFSKLWNLQTLIVKTVSRTLDIKADIWKMVNLRYLKTNASASLPKSGKIGKEGEKLQTLGTVSPQSCTEDVFNRARNLRRLGIRGRLSLLLEGKSGSFDSLVKLCSLEKLKLINDVFPTPPSKDHLSGLPKHDKFPPQLTSLTLAETFLDWSQMSILGLLINLEVLKLKDNAFVGKSWEMIEGGFSRLEVLQMGRTDLIRWVASGHHFPKLRRLELINCVELKEIPIGFANIPSLLWLNLNSSNFAIGSAQKIRDTIKENRGKQNAIAREFKLSIFPQDGSTV